jgi:CelD/BcsL family acetyltransferase involved in cellulose biosynthesis
MSGERQATVRRNVGTSISLDMVPTLEAVRDDWVELAQKGGNIFSSWEWASIWWRHCGGARPLLVAACRTDDGRLAAVLPLYLWSARPLRIARFLGHGPADELGPVCAPVDRAYAAAALRRSCVEAGLDLLLAQHLPGRQGWREALGATLLEAEASPTLSLERGWDVYLASRSANFRQQIRGRERQLARRHSVRFRLVTDRARLEDDLTVLFSLHAARWGERSAFTGWEQFHRDFAHIALERGWLRLWFLDVDDRPAAAWYGFRFGGIESYYQAGRDPRLADGSVGFVLLVHSIREAAADGMREYRFLRGAEPFKLRFADADPGVETLVLSRGLAGRLGEIAAAARARGRSLRSRLHRLAVAS